MSRPPRFTWKTTDGAEHEFEVTAAEISIGRAPTCDIVLADDQMVSRRHAVVRRQGNVCTLVDLGSSNGTLINGIEIHDSTILRQQDQVTIGDHNLLFTEAAEVPQPVAPGLGYMPNIESMPTNVNTGPVPFQPFVSPGPVPPSVWAPPPLETPALTGTPPRSSFDIYSEQDTGSLGVMEQVSSSYVHTHNGKEVERDESSSRVQDQFSFNRGAVEHVIDWQPTPSVPMPPPTPVAPTPIAPPTTEGGQRQDASALLMTIRQLTEQLESKVGEADQATSQIRTQLLSALSQFDVALHSAQAVATPAVLSELQQLADNVYRTPHVEQVATLSRRAGELRDILAAYQQLLNTLGNFRGQVDQALS